MAVSMSLSDGWGLVASSADADIIWPAWHYPHCGTSTSIQARCTGWVPSADNPSMVVTGSFTVPTCVWQDRTALPFTWTVQAPQSPAPQPNLVPFMSRTSRRTHKRGVSAGTSTVLDCPFTLSVYAMSHSPEPAATPAGGVSVANTSVEVIGLIRVSHVESNTWPIRCQGQAATSSIATVASREGNP